MTEIKLTKRYPQSRTEDIVDAYMRGWNDALDAVQNGKFIINDDRKTEPSGYKMKPIEQTEPQIRLDKDNKTLWIKNTLDGYDRVIVEEDVFCRIFYEDCGECAHNKTEPQTNERLKRSGFRKTEEVDKFFNENWMHILDILDDALYEYLTERSE